jgi:Fe-S cluster biogenesis protein NfuA
MSVTAQPTPNPATLKFLLDADILDGGTADFADAAAAAGQPLPERLFALPGIAGVFLGRDFVSVSKAADADWADLEDAVAAAIAAHLADGGPALHPRPAVPEGPVAAADQPVVDRILELLDSHIRPGIALDGGNIAFKTYADGIVYLELQGACAGCPSSVMTLRYSVENLLRHYIPEVREVRAA